jgi:hypothetical protein
MLGMDLHSHREQMERWIELGRLERLTFAQLSNRSGFHARTLRRWSSRLRAEAERSDAVACAVDTPAQAPAFVELIERDERLRAAEIEIVLSGDRRIVVSGAFDEDVLLRVVRVLERC